jgi:hypothetical protein
MKSIKLTTMLTAIVSIGLSAVTGSGCRSNLDPPPRHANKQAYREAISELKAARDPYKRWCALGDAAKESLAYGQDAEAKAYANELRTLAPSHAIDSNYGNAIQDYHIVLGVLALKAGDRTTAEQHLLEAGRSPGSPQMDTFGPNMTLAKALLEQGRKKTVLRYFELCRKFWKMDDGRLDRWRDAVRTGRIPDFGANLHY